MICPGCREYAGLPGGCECPELEPAMPEIEHQPARECMTGFNFTSGLRAEFRTCDALDAPWLLPMGGVSALVEPGVADCAVEREQDDEESILARAAEIEAAELCREAA